VAMVVSLDPHKFGVPAAGRGGKALVREGHDLANFAWGFGKAYGSIFSWTSGENAPLPLLTPTRGDAG
jgi:hypothetical protein